MKKQRLFESKTKRLVDIFVSIMGIIVFLPIWIIIALLIKITSPGPILFTQDRPGYHKKIFKVYKFRTMYPGSEKMVKGKEVMKDDSRVTGFGKFLRRSKLDEIPQLWNVLKGDMSLVGPRPDVPGYVDCLTGEERDVLKLKPGITGPASLKYRNEEILLTKVENPQKYNDEVVFPDKIRINLYYYRNYSFWKDLQMIVCTILGRKMKYNNELI